MRIRMTDPVPGQKGKVREVSDSYGLRLISQGRAVALAPLPASGTVTGGNDARTLLLGDTAPECIIHEEQVPEKEGRKPTAPLPVKGTKGSKGGAGNGA